MLGPSSFLALPPPAWPAAACDPDGKARPVPAVTRVVGLRDDPHARRPRPESERSQSQRQSPRTAAAPDPAGAQSGATARAPARPAGSTPQFLTQVFGQDMAHDADALARRRNGPALGSLAYRRAGGEPVLYSQEPAIFRVAI